MLSQMLRQMFTGNPLTLFPIVALALFLMVFTAVCVGVLRRRAAAYDGIANLPLDDEEVRDER